MGNQITGAVAPDGTAAPEWAAADGDAAGREGWDIFQCDGSGGGMWQIQRIDDLGEVNADAAARLLADDEDAWMRVWSVPSELHARALAFIRVMNPAEWEAITELALEMAVPAANLPADPSPVGLDNVTGSR
jgi:hypothetical protein